jgi:hypothetical protein
LEVSVLVYVYDLGLVELGAPYALSRGLGSAESSVCHGFVAASFLAHLFVQLLLLSVVGIEPLLLCQSPLVLWRCQELRPSLGDLL